MREKPKPKSLPLFEVAKSIAAAAFGVRSNRLKERDFTHGNHLHFIIGGIIFTLLFILSVAFVVHLVLKNAGAT